MIKNVIFAALLASSFFITACEQDEILELKSADGRWSPFQHVERVFIVPNVTYHGCSEDRSEIPNHLLPDRIVPSLTKATYGKGTFNRLESRRFAPPLSKNRIITTTTPEELFYNDLQIDIYFDYRCDDESKNFSFRWQTKRSPEFNAYIRKSEDLWWGPDNPLHGSNIPFDVSEEDLKYKIETNQFQRLEIDYCGLKYSKPMYHPETVRVVCR